VAGAVPHPEGRYEQRESVELAFVAALLELLADDPRFLMLVDELHLMVGAAVIGGGTPLFGTGPPGRLRLAGSRPASTAPTT
jgi:hypothetical protein